jgi:DNA-directed RNA polymerase specialized sigma24 family protein
MRAVLVLRFFDDMSEADIATALRCSTGTVKSQTSRGLTRLRELLDKDAVLPAIETGHR